MDNGPGSGRSGRDDVLQFIHFPSRGLILVLMVEMAFQAIDEIDRAGFFPAYLKGNLALKGDVVGNDGKSGLQVQGPDLPLSVGIVKFQNSFAEFAAAMPLELRGKMPQQFGCREDRQGKHDMLDRYL